MSLPTLLLSEDLLIKPEPLTPSAFAPFGTVIASPFAPSLSNYPMSKRPTPETLDDPTRQPIPIPEPLYPEIQPQPVSANQLTALKTSPISPLVNNYPPTDPSQGRHQAGQGLMSIFSSFPRENVYTVGFGSQRTLRLKLGILERHPYTTQTFCPFNYSEPIDKVQKGDQVDSTYMVIVVAPTISGPSSKPTNPPDLNSIRIFFTPLNKSKFPNMAVTYNAGTWHAPMIVLGSRRVDFLVTQFANGVSDDDCQEVLIGSGPDESHPSQKEFYIRWREGGLSPSFKHAEIDVTFLEKSNEEKEEDAKLKWTTDEVITRTVEASKKANL
ncbi:hypothetical protein H2198_003793 [Neophaeococcomyces mojaviensis]|uniref:Uncharacterized protein n=1 Tax=Neophaeococcomyces mojaviensis TaxID=3383035 RepID=A0ACC3AAM1_9EURO|nr:hypothetical protein H2198_003793 [Knufia sp. JES_112]